MRRQQGFQAVFTEDGPLGLRFGQDEDTGACTVLAVVGGTQAAEDHPHLRPGLELTRVNDRRVAGMEYLAVLQLLKGAGRPLRLAFRGSRAGSAGRMSSPSASRPGPPADGVISTDFRLSSPRMTAEEAVFTEDGPLGLRFGQDEDTGACTVLAIAGGTQAAEDHPHLRPGLELTRVNDRRVAGMEYLAVLQLLKGAGRPLRLAFQAGSAGRRLPRSQGGGVSPSRPYSPRAHDSTDAHVSHSRWAAGAHAREQEAGRRLSIPLVGDEPEVDVSFLRRRTLAMHFDPLTPLKQQPVRHGAAVDTAWQPRSLHGVPAVPSVVHNLSQWSRGGQSWRAATPLAEPLQPSLAAMESPPPPPPPAAPSESPMASVFADKLRQIRADRDKQSLDLLESPPPPAAPSVSPMASVYTDKLRQIRADRDKQSLDLESLWVAERVRGRAAVRQQIPTAIWASTQEVHAANADHASVARHSRPYYDSHLSALDEDLIVQDALQVGQCVSMLMRPF
jgi:hypothetical protein